MHNQSPLIDIGINLCDRRFNKDREDVIDRALRAGVTRMVVTGTTFDSSREALALAQTYPTVLWATAGVHPHYAKQCNHQLVEHLKNLASAHPQVVAIGECGLDYNRNFSPPATQRKWLEAQIELASVLQMPLFLHERDAAHDLTSILRAYRDQIPRAVIHCFTGTRTTLRTYLDIDLHIGITGWICDERRGHHLKDLLSDIPENRLMIETDGPYLLPRTMQRPPKSRRNEPCNLPYVLSAVADALRKTETEVAQSTTATAQKFFALPTSA